MKRFFSGKVSLSILLTLSVLLGAFFLGKAVTKVFATTDGWVNVGGCIAPCGSSAGKQQQSKTTPGYTTPKVCEKTCVGVTEPFSTSRNVDDYATRYAAMVWQGNQYRCPNQDSSYIYSTHGNWMWYGDWEYPCDKSVKVGSHTETFTATITYGEKSSDPTKCHKETPVTPSIPSWATSAFNALPQTKDKIDSTTCTGGVWVPESTEYREVNCTATVVACSPSCGNGDLEAGEQCDDGNIMSGDGCSSTCQSETSSCPEVYIGDGYCDEVCNNAENNWDGGDCEVVGPVCGNEIVERGEDCDDGNTVNGDGCSADCQNESVEPTPTPTPNPDLCLNIDGIQYTVPEGLHINATGVECVAYGTPGVEESSSSTTGTVLGASTSVGGGQVLGASTMAGTGSFDQMAYQAIMVLGGTLSAFGLKNFKKASKKA